MKKFFFAWTLLFFYFSTPYIYCQSDIIRQTRDLSPFITAPDYGEPDASGLPQKPSDTSRQNKEDIFFPEEKNSKNKNREGNQTIKNEAKKITINSARSTEYRKIDSRDPSKKDEVIIFTGNVSISVADGSSISTITADKIIYNKSRSTLEAGGKVFYQRKVGTSSGESFTGTFLLFDIEKMQGVFLDGTIRQASNKKGKDPFVVHTRVAARDESKVVAFKNGLLTTSKEDDPLWSIRASRIWMLPGNEIAFVNGFLSVGIVPIIYMPFFYYPTDEMLFHPVFGFKSREGYFLQTTTYLIGRKPIVKQEGGSSFSNFMQGDILKEQKLEGLFFKNLDEDAKRQDPNYLKLIGDIYSGLGYLAGLEGKFQPSKGYVKQISFASYLGFSHTLYPASADPKEKSSAHSIYSGNVKGKAPFNKSNLFGKIVPFRYYFDFNMSMTKNPFNLSASFPFICDPYFKKDYMTRSEDMNWFKYLLDQDKKDEQTKSSEIYSYDWKLDSSIRPSFPVLSPWVSSMSLDAVSGTLSFYSKENKELEGIESQYAPERRFYFPQTFKPHLKASLNGTIISTSMFDRKPRRTHQRTQLAEGVKEIKNPFIEEEEPAKEEKPNEKSSEQDDIKNKKGSGKEKAKKTVKKEEKTSKELYEETVGSISDSIIPLYKISDSHSSSPLIDYSLSYKLNGSFLQETTFDEEKWKKPQDIKWTQLFSRFYKLTGDAGLSSNLSIYQNFISLTNSLTVTANYQKYPWIKEETDPALKPRHDRNVEGRKLNNYKANIYSLKNENTLKFSPFVHYDLFKTVNFQWTISEILARNKFSGTYKKPEWTKEKVKWDKEFIKTHSASATAGISIFEYDQTITFSANLPPLLAAYSGSASFKFPYGSLSMSTRFFEKEKEKKKWFWDPFKMELSWSFPYELKASQSYVYNIEDKKHDKLNLSFSWSYLTAFYNMSREIPYKLEGGKGWVHDGKDKKFLPYSAGISFSNSSKPWELYSWKNRIKFHSSVSSSLQLNLLKVTDSYFTFTPSITFKIHEFLDFTFSATSRNDSIARYFQKAFKLPIEIAGEKNIVKDLASSFYLWDTNSRKKSSFKLKSLNFEITHHLKDWLMKLSYSVKPEFKTEKGKKLYTFDPTISFVVQWNPIGDIKVQAKKENKKFTLERGKIK